MSQRSTSPASVADQLSACLVNHNLRLEELRSFHKTHKIRLSPDVRSEFNDIVDSISSILGSVALQKSAKYISDSVVDVVSKEIAGFSDHLAEKAESAHHSHSPSNVAIQHGPLLPKSYANAVRSTKKANTRSTDPKNAYLNNRNVLFVKKRKNNLGEDVTFSEVNSLLRNDPTVKINKMFDNENNIKIISHDETSSNKVKKYLTCKVGLEVSEKALFDPCIIISGIPQNLDDDFVLQELNFRNGAPESRTKIIRKITSANSRFIRIIIRSSADFRDSVLRSGRVFIGSSSHRAEDYIHVLKCFKCQRYGHVAGSCSHDAACGLCSKPHLTRDCPRSEEPHTCINCVRGNKTSVNHTTNWSKCPFLINAIINQTEATNYGFTH